MSIEGYEQDKNSVGTAFADEMYNRAPSMYKNCKDKVESVSKQIEQNNGLLYKDFETAKKYYLAKGRLEGTEPEIVAFNDLMEFVYLGRKEADVEVKPAMVTIRVDRSNA